MRGRRRAIRFSAFWKDSGFLYLSYSSSMYSVPNTVLVHDCNGQCSEFQQSNKRTPGPHGKSCLNYMQFSTFSALLTYAEKRSARLSMIQHLSASFSVIQYNSASFSILFQYALAPCYYCDIFQHNSANFSI